MAVNTASPSTIRQAGAQRAGGMRLYLREEELDAGLAMVFDAAASLKAAAEPDRRALDLSWADARALSAAARAAETVLGLAARLAVTKQALAKTLAGLERRGLLERVADVRDGRRRVVRLTDAGQAAERALAAAMRARLANAYRSAGDEAVAGCDRVLRAVAGLRPPAGEGGDGP
jgi:DNA-binding MarR family transcriptional regulator